MRKLIGILILASFIAPSAQAVVDPDPDGIGIYFDLNADIYQTVVGPSSPFDAYVILTNPTWAEILGYEFSRHISVPPGMEGMVIWLDRTWTGFNELLPVELPDLGDNVMLGMVAPLPTSPAVVLVRWQFMLLTPMVMDFYLGPSNGEFGTNGRLAYESEAGWVPMYVSSGDPGLLVATVNGTGVVPATSTTFGSLKALFR